MIVYLKKFHSAFFLLNDECRVFKRFSNIFTQWRQSHRFSALRGVSGGLREAVLTLREAVTLIPGFLASSTPSPFTPVTQAIVILLFFKLFYSSKIIWINK